jgi:hypothetical protein
LDGGGQLVGGDDELNIDSKTSISVVNKKQQVGGKTRRKAIKVPILGDNSYKELPINMANISQLTLTMEGSGRYHLFHSTTLENPRGRSSPQQRAHRDSVPAN